LRPINFLEAAATSYEPYLQASGELHDPVLGCPTQYGTAYFAYCQATLARFGPEGRGQEHAQAAMKGLEAAIAYVQDPTAPNAASGITVGLTGRNDAHISAINHRDFFWPPILKTYRILKALSESGKAGVEAQRVQALADRIKAVDIEASFHQRPPSNWAAVWLLGEWLRMKEGLSPFDMTQMDAWLAAFAGRYEAERAFYHESGHSNAYDLFTRLHLAQIAGEDYPPQGAGSGLLVENTPVGAWIATTLSGPCLTRSLALQLSDGSLASAHRSTGQTWTVGAQIAYFTLLAQTQQGDLSKRAKHAARLAYTSLVRYQRSGGVFSPVENTLPADYRVGYEFYTADAHYGCLALGFLADAIALGFADSPIEASGHQSPQVQVHEPGKVWREEDPLFRSLLHYGPYSLHINAWPAPKYDGFGVVDATFGPGRRLQLVSSVRAMNTDRFFNLGIAQRRNAGPEPLEPFAQRGDLMPIDETGGPEWADLLVQARPQGLHWLYRIAATIDEQGIRVEESTPGRLGHLSLLLPYPREVGTNQTTSVLVRPGEVACEADLTLGGETIRLTLEGKVSFWFDQPIGFENRRGLCGLLRLDLAEPTEKLEYRLRVVR
jgi:hypothetical protein